MFFFQGVVLTKVPVPDYNNWGEGTRDFAYDPSRNVFYALDVNFTGTQQQRPLGGRDVYLSIINPLDGSVVEKKVTGAKGKKKKKINLKKNNIIFLII